RVSASPAIRVTDRNPTETRYFRTRRDAVRGVNWIDEDAVGIHERILGRPVAAIARESPPREVRCDGNGADLATALSKDAAPTVRLTCAGLAGDTGTGTACYRLALSDPSRQHLVAEESDYQRLKLTREVVRTSRDTTLMRPGQLMAYALGCDATTMLPPFFPIGRGEEGPFAGLLSKACPTAFVGHLPELM